MSTRYRQSKQKCHYEVIECSFIAVILLVYEFLWPSNIALLKLQTKLTFFSPTLSNNMITSRVITGLNCLSCWQYCCNGNRSVCKQGADSLCPTWYANCLGLWPKRLLLHLTFTVNCSRALFVTTVAYHWLCPPLFIWHECLLKLGDVKDVVWHMQLYWKPVPTASIKVHRFTQTHLTHTCQHWDVKVRKITNNRTNKVQ